MRVNVNELKVAAEKAEILNATLNAIDEVTLAIETITPNLSNLDTVADNISSINTVATYASDLSTVITDIIPNMAEILLADTNATTATEQAVISTTQAGIAVTSAQNAGTYAQSAQSNAALTAQDVRDAQASALAAAQSEANASQIVTAPLLMSYGNLSAPLLDMPLKNSLAMKAGVGSATFTRASTATYIDRYGVLKTAAINEPRFEKEGYLNEGNSTNLCLYSETIGSWATITNYGVYSNAIVAPDGNTTADRLMETAVTSSFEISNSYNAVAGTVMTMSAFLQPVGSTQYAMFQLAGASSLSISFDILNGIIDGVGGGIEKYSIKKVGSFYYCTATWTDTLTASRSIRIRGRNTSWVGGNAGASETYLGNTSNGITVWGVQVEALPFATSYIPTTSATVTRSADILSVTRANNFPDAQNNVDGFSVVLDVNSLGVPNTTSYIWAVYASTSDYVGVFANSLYFANKLQNSTVDVNSLAAHNGTCKRRLVTTHSNSSLKIYLDGVLTDTDTNTSGRLGDTLNSVLNIRIGGFSSSTANTINGHIKNFKVYDFPLTAQEAALA